MPTERALRAAGLRRTAYNILVLMASQGDEYAKKLLRVDSMAETTHIPRIISEDLRLPALEAVAEAAKALCSLRGDVTEGDRANLRAALAKLDGEK